MSPELRRRYGSDEVSLEKLSCVLSAKAAYADGVTISGGEPFEQGEDLYRLVSFLESNISEDILVYTGWSFSQVLSDEWGSKTAKLVATIIDGEYVAELDDGFGLRGSTNQTIHRLNPSPYFDYERCERRVQGFVYENKLFTAGLR